MSEPTSRLQRWILESQQALLKRKRRAATEYTRPEAGRSEQHEQKFLLWE
jgi:hypothetical protein